METEPYRRTLLTRIPGLQIETIVPIVGGWDSQVFEVNNSESRLGFIKLRHGLETGSSAHLCRGLEQVAALPGEESLKGDC